MRSTNLVIFLVLLNVSAGVVAVAAPVDVDPLVGGQQEIDQTAGDVENRDVSRRGSGELIGSFLGLGGLLRDIGTIIFYGPEMLRNLGAPGLLVTGFETVLIFVLGFDVAEAITGRRLS